PPQFSPCQPNGNRGGDPVMTSEHVYNLRSGRRTSAQGLGKLAQVLRRSVQVPRKPQRSRNWHFEELENRLTPSALSAGILLLDPIGIGSLSVLGHATATVTNGSVVVDSTNPAGAFANGTASVSAPQFVISGTPGYVTAGSGQF